MILTSAKTTAAQIGRNDILTDYEHVYGSREVSLLARREVFMGKAKFAILGDGKELPQVAMARIFKLGDWRSGYYRDQTFMFASGMTTKKAFFAQLYAHTNPDDEPMSGGRQMSCHFATRTLDDNGRFVNLANRKNSSADTSPTGSQMPRLLGLAQASKLFRLNHDLHEFKNFSTNGNEIAFGTIGNASCAEGMFWETINAAAVLQVPMILSVWDDDYGISVHNELQMAKSDIYEALLGFKRNGVGKGIELLQVKGWDYQALLDTYFYAEQVCRTEHIPVVIHVTELTQPQGHSTSGSHERYKSKERLSWEKEYDCLTQFRKYILENGFATEDELTEIEKTQTLAAKNARDEAYKAYLESFVADHKLAIELLLEAENESRNMLEIQKLRKGLEGKTHLTRKDSFIAIRKAISVLRFENIESRRRLQEYGKRILAENQLRYNTFIYSASEQSALNVAAVEAVFSSKSPTIDGREILQACFDKHLATNPLFLAFGEDVGKIGDVNQAFAGLQEKHGVLRVEDTGIRECTIIGQGIGLAMRGLRPLAEIQYLDYLLYAIQILSDDLATLQYRSHGGQKAPLIIRTRGHRLEGMWHAGSPLGMMINTLRGMYICVPRNMTQAAGFYNTLLKGDDPAVVVEPLNGYRLKEKLPDNITEFTVPLGVPEIVREGTDVTLVTYGSMVRICYEAAEQLEDMGIDTEVIDVQTLLPFDRYHIIAKSLEKTSRLVIADEDVPGGASGFILQQIIEKQNGYRLLDSQPITITAKDHRTPFGSDGDYFTKPTADGIFEAIYNLMRESDEKRFPDLYA